MEIREIRALRGANYYSRYPAIYMLLDIGELEDLPSNKVAGLKERLEALIPTLHEHRCSPGHAGGFLERVGEGTWAGHIVEHVAIELQCLANIDVGFGKTRETDERGVYTIIYRYRDEEVGIEAGRAAVGIVSSLFKGEEAEIEPIITRLKEMREDSMLGPSTNSIVMEARARGIPTIRLNKHSYVQLGHGVHQRRIQATMMDNTSAIGVEIADDKEQTKEILEEAGIPVPKGEAVQTLESARDIAEEIGYPVVVKPLVGHHGQGITANIKDAHELEVAYVNAKKIHEYVLVETYLQGFDHRILVINGKFVAAARREPTSITGNGSSTIQELIDEVNKDPKRGIGHEKVLTRIDVDYQTERLLAQKELTLDDVLPEGTELLLKSTANLSTGGVAIDVTSEVHPFVKRMAERISRFIDINVIGIDVIAPHLRSPLKETGGGIVEVNAAPGFRVHLDPFVGSPRNVAEPIIDMLFPPGSDSSIPIIAVTGTNGKTTTVRLISHILKYSGKKVGMSCTDGIEIGNNMILDGDYSGPAGSQFILKDPTVDHAVLEIARGGILRRGLGYDESDVAVFLNVASDHLGDGGIDTIEDLAELKRIVVETAKPSGYVVLNADDALVLESRSTITANVILFSLDPDNPAITEHVANDRIAATVKDGNIVVRKGTLDYDVVKTSDIPLTFGGHALFNVANSLAAVAATYALGISTRNIKAGLVTFNPTIGQLPGRMNLLEVGNFKVIIDYGHNVPAIEALGALLPYLTKGKKITMANGTGNRLDEDIIEFGQSIGKIYDFIFISDADPRRRKRGETARLVQEGIVSTGFPKEKIKITLDEREATLAALNMAEDGDLVVIQADDIKMTIEAVLGFKEKIESPGPVE